MITVCGTRYLTLRRLGFLGYDDDDDDDRFRLSTALLLVLLACELDVCWNELKRTTLNRTHMIVAIGNGSGRLRRRILHHILSKLFLFRMIVSAICGRCVA